MIRQHVIPTMQAMPSNPMALQLTNWVSFFFRFWRAFDMDPREMMVQQQPNQMGQDAAMLQGGQGADIMGGGFLQQLEPGMLGPQPTARVNQMAAMGAGLQQNAGQ